MKKKILGIGSIVGLCVLLRLSPHAPNVAPMTAFALFSGYAFKSRWSPGLILLTNLITDLFIGFYSWKVMLAVYGSYVLIALIGRWQGAHAFGVAFGTLLGSVVFFVITNGAVWAFSSWYGHSFAGLLAAYANGLLFFRNSLLGDLLYGGLFFAAYALVTRSADAPSEAKQAPLSI